MQAFRPFDRAGVFPAPIMSTHAACSSPRTKKSLVPAINCMPGSSSPHSNTTPGTARELTSARSLSSARISSARISVALSDTDCTPRSYLLRFPDGSMAHTPLSAVLIRSPDFEGSDDALSPQRVAKVFFEERRREATKEAPVMNLLQTIDATGAATQSPPSSARSGTPWTASRLAAHHSFRIRAEVKSCVDGTNTVSRLGGCEPLASAGESSPRLESRLASAASRLSVQLQVLEALAAQSDVGGGRDIGRRVASEALDLGMDAIGDGLHPSAGGHAGLAHGRGAAE